MERAISTPHRQPAFLNRRETAALLSLKRHEKSPRTAVTDHNGRAAVLVFLGILIERARTGKVRVPFGYARDNDANNLVQEQMGIPSNYLTFTSHPSLASQ